MNILLIDTYSLELQEELLKLGHKIYVFLNYSNYDIYSEKLKAKDFLKDDVLNQKYGTKECIYPLKFSPYTIPQYATDPANDWIKQNIDLVIQVDDIQTEVYNYFQQLKIPIIGRNKKIRQIEDDRIFANMLFESIGGNILESITMTSEEALEFIPKSKKEWVLKAAVGDIDDNKPTIVPYSNEELLQHIKVQSFDVLLQEKTYFPQLCVTGIFDGSKFARDKDGNIFTFLNFEQKGTNNNDLGRIYTGEVGTTITCATMCDKIQDLFVKIQPFLQDNMVGFFDFNLAIDPETLEIYLLEYTPRFGVPTYLTMMSLITDGKNFGDFIIDMGYIRNLDQYFDTNLIAVGGCHFGYGNGLSYNIDSQFSPIIIGVDKLRQQGLDVRLLYSQYQKDEDGNAILDKIKSHPFDRAFTTISVGTKLDPVKEKLNQNIGLAKGYGVVHRTDYGEIMTPELKKLLYKVLPNFADRTKFGME